jgi:subtilisin family serine protease
METLIDQQIAALGHAKVLIALKPQAFGSALADGDLTTVANVARNSLEPYFVPPDQQQSAALAVTAAHFAGRKRVPSRGLERAKVRVFPRLGLAVGIVDASGAESLRNDPLVANIHPAGNLSLIRPVEVRPARAVAAPSWGVVRLKVPTLWKNGIDGKGVVVGHLDTGVAGDHPALAGAISAFAEFDLAGNQVSGAKPHDSDEHGTHTAGSIVGRPNPRGAFGIAPGARIASALVIEGGQVIDRILAGLEWIVGRNVRIMSMSLGLRGYTPAFQELIDALRRNNVLPVIAAGNEGPDTSRSPGNYDNVLSVGACAADDTVADFSSSQKFAREQDPYVPDLVAPGVDILSCVPGGKFARMDGTSMATPHVAGLAALLLQARPTASSADLEAAIIGSCLRPASMPDYRANRGVPDAVHALRILTGRDLAAPAAEARASSRRRAAPRAVRRKEVA